MSTEISIETLTTAEKLALLDRLWANLAQSPAEIPSPEWHQRVLAERITAVEQGRSKPIPIEEARAILMARFECK